MTSGCNCPTTVKYNYSTRTQVHKHLDLHKSLPYLFSTEFTKSVNLFGDGAGMPLRRPLLSQAAQLQHILRLSFRPSLVGSFFHPRHNFHSSDAIAAEEFTHYDTLNLSRTATTAEIKRYWSISVLSAIIFPEG